MENKYLSPFIHLKFRFIQKFVIKQKLTIKKEFIIFDSNLRSFAHLSLHYIIQFHYKITLKPNTFSAHRAQFRRLRVALKNVDGDDPLLWSVYIMFNYYRISRVLLLIITSALRWSNGDYGQEASCFWFGGLDLRA